ncbi:39S ribosomal protein L23, mitochondrial-like [Eriocheir sinensis]|uniref:39S ribosomal protein L23, mitochondrial-like n=1 Tax=Eriocheir sinensis TaxID=95602 RepID=UPI0021C6EC00|nr:39S ribosomal protein L23, mitochondrial-like [Eriocheir sinensis]
MSTRWYPLYRHGNPQLRVFLPNFFMKIVKPKDPQPPNVVQFHVSPEMTKYDIKNYLEKIYKINVENIITHNKMGEFSRSKFGGYIVKDDDYKVAYVTLPKDQKFEFPDLFPKEKEEEVEKQKKQIKILEREFKRITRLHNHRHGVPGWFGV